jgi:hypothetical protein
VTRRDYLVRVGGVFIVNTRGALIKFTEAGAHRWAERHKPQGYSVVRLGDQRPAIVRTHSTDL